MFTYASAVNSALELKVTIPSDQEALRIKTTKFPLASVDLTLEGKRVIRLSYSYQKSDLKRREKVGEFFQV